MGKCKHCGQSAKEGNVYCSYACRNKAKAKFTDYKKIGEKVSKTISEKSKAKRVTRTIHCDFCGSEIEQKSNTRGEYPTTAFCSKTCAAKYSTKDNKGKTKSIVCELCDKEVKIPINSGQNRCNVCLTEKTCPQCGNPFHSKNKFCSKACLKESRKSKKEGIEAYRIECAFRFSLRDYPDKFDFSLIEMYGMYSASNRGGNLTGVQRDHMYSVSDGFQNNVSPDILSHPANCALLIANDNFSKCGKSSITLEELLDRIDNW